MRNSITIVKRNSINDQLHNMTLYAEGGSNPSTCSVVNDVCKIKDDGSENIRNCDILINTNCRK